MRDSAPNWGRTSARRWQDIVVGDHGSSGEVAFIAFVPAPVLGVSAFADIRLGNDPGEMFLLRRAPRRGARRWP